MAIMSLFQKSTSVDVCPICGESSRVLINLESYPITEVYQIYGRNDFKYPTEFSQAFNFCEICTHGFLREQLPRDFIYENYNTHTAASIGSVVATNHFYDFILKYIPNNFNVVIDIGANDVTLLKKFSETSARLIGVDPNIASDTPQILCIKDYIENIDLTQFGYSSRLFLCSHTLEHLYNLDYFFENLSKIASEDDHFFFQFPSLDLLVRDCRFDQIHHQHLHYFSLYSFQRLLNTYGFGLLSHEFDPSHYGALMVYFIKKKPDIKLGAGGIVTKENIISSYEAYVASMEAANKRIGRDDFKFYCYGASLMLPILNYYIPNLINTVAILDTNPSKFGMSYVNFDKKIIDADCFDYRRSNIVLTAISTKLAARKIIADLALRETMNVVLPFNTL